MNQWNVIAISQKINIMEVSEMNKMVWDKNEEYKFFKKTLGIDTSEQLLYLTENRGYSAYLSKNYKGEKQHYKVEIPLLEIICINL